jgi:hypothetical protein
MSRIVKVAVAAAALGVAGAFTAVAVAASSPTVATLAASKITVNSAVLRADVNPQGHQTSWLFQYGPTTAYGFQTTSHSAGQGTRRRLVAIRVTGLLPGTVYHYRVAALSSAGGATGADRAFRTLGKPPPVPETGPAVNVGQNQATPTGTVNPSGGATSWYFQYVVCPDFPAPCPSTTVPYTSRTIGQPPIPAGNIPVPVSVQITGLAPGKLYRYRLVAVHPNATSAGSELLFFTQPRFRRKPNMTTRTSPKHLSRRPYTFTTAGTLHGATFIPNWLRCTGHVGIRYYAGRHQKKFVLVSVGSDCRFSTPVSFRRLVNGRSTALKVKIFYRGNGYLRSVERTDHVTLG